MLSFPIGLKWKRIYKTALIKLLHKRSAPTSGENITDVLKHPFFLAGLGRLLQKRSSRLGNQNCRVNWTLSTWTMNLILDAYQEVSSPSRNKSHNLPSLAGKWDKKNASPVAQDPMFKDFTTL
jgi:hypothetical protein